MVNECLTGIRHAFAVATGDPDSVQSAGQPGATAPRIQSYAQRPLQASLKDKTDEMMGKGLTIQAICHRPTRTRCGRAARLAVAATLSILAARLAVAATLSILCASFAPHPVAAQSILSEPQAGSAQDQTALKPLVAYAARVAGDAERIRVVIEFETEPTFSIGYLAEPNRIVVTLPETAFGFPNEMLEARGLLETVRFGKIDKGRSRLVFGLKSPARLELAQAQSIDGGGNRLVLDISQVDADSFAKLVASTDWSAFAPPLDAAVGSAEDPFTVVVDAGHGGIDSGAEGAAGSKEKDVTLAFAQALDAALEDLGGFSVVMTRTDDTFLSLSGRVRMAREKQADLLISLHADSISVPTLRGATVYTLSDRASDAIAASLVAQEHPEETIAGNRLAGAEGVVARILMDLARSETQVFSTGLAEKVIQSFEGEVKLINNPHRQAGFRVLQAPDVPSALVELGYLSNPEDEKLLTDPDWRESTARLLALSVKSYQDTILAGRP